jgi:Putative adhesin
VHCDNCGAAVLPGHRFCRACGRATDDYAEEGTPTQMMPPEPPARGSRDTATATPSRANTNPVYTPPQQTQQPNYYQQQPYAPIQSPQPLPHYTPPRSRSPWGWIVAVIAICLIGAFALGIFFVANGPSGDRDGDRSGRAAPPPLPTQPPPAPGTTKIKSFPFAAKGGNLTLETITGDITIEGWDEPRAEVKITSSGNSEVIDKSDGSNLKLTTDPRGGGDVKYEIKLPRNAGRVEIRATSSDIALSDFTGNVQINNDNGSVTMSDMNGDIKVNMTNGDVSFSDVQGVLGVNTASGSIDLQDVNGKITANSASGDISVSFAGGNLEPLFLNTVSGDIEVTFDSDVNADLTVKTLTGDIEVAEDFGIDVRSTPPVGKEARGRIGGGGQSIRINTTAGDVRIQKQ